MKTSPSEHPTPVRTPGALTALSERYGLAAVAVLTVAVRIAHIAPARANGVGLEYLRDATIFAAGSIPASRLSPGLPALLAPVAFVTGGRFYPLFHATQALMVAALVGAIVLLYRFLRDEVGHTIALSLTAAVALAQASTLYLRDAEIEPVALLLVTASIVTFRSGRGAATVALTTLAVLVRVALAPFAIVLWALRLRREPRLALAGIGMGGLGVLAHVWTDATTDLSYGQILSSTYTSDGVASSAGSAISSIATRLGDYLSYGVPNVFAPWAVVRVVGPLVMAVLAALLVIGLVRRFRPSAAIEPWLVAVLVASAAYFATLLVWPIRRLVMVRMVLPMAAPLLLLLGSGLAALRDRSRGWRWPANAALAAVVILSLGGTAVTVRKIETPPKLDEQIMVLELAAGRLPDTTIMANDPAVARLVTGREVVEFPFPRGYDRVARQAETTGACAFVVGPELRRKDPEAVRWLADRGASTIATDGDHAVVTIDAAWCA